MSSIQIGHQTIGLDHEPFIIAEMSGNHDQSLEKALALVDAAAEAGVHALKLQTYTAETMTLPLKEREFLIENPDSLWSGYSLYELYDKAHTPWEWHPALMERCQEKDLICFSTPFDETAVEFLESLDVPAYKIASFENTDLALIKRVAATGKPLIISTGLASEKELETAVLTARSAGCKELILLKCTSSYPADPCLSNLRMIPELKERFQVEVGLSDHTLGIGAAVASVALGATVIEKHFTLDRAQGGVDAAFSLEPVEMAQLVYETKTVWQALGDISYALSADEQANLQFRRSLYITQPLKKGDRITHKNIRAIRPGFGLAPTYLEQVIGKVLKEDVISGTPLSWNLLE